MSDPPRWMDDPSAPADLRRALDQASRHAPPLDTVAGLAMLERAMRGSPPPGGGAGGASGMGASGMAAAALVIAALGGTAYWAATAADDDSDAAPETAAHRAPPMAGDGTADVRTDVTPTDVAPTEVAPARDVGSVIARAEGEDDEARAEDLGTDARRARTSHDTAGAGATGLAADREAARTRSSTARGDVVDPGATPPADDDRLAREMAELAAAGRALASDPSRALSLLERGRREHGAQSLFAEEREALSIVALTASHREDEARARAERFLRAHPDSPHAERIRRAITPAIAP